ncbi:hypothetical protein PANT_19c00093 [Moesziomyces antarcticus T-34]|uniref:Uncharacterized protein n=1 Tax=Pseudozyma antarctica (strain T-34) TaxID=1151754 RepID=M9MFD5_PSEA3|nr:hypothetical protein PANT_19c00093 [Moesziomyces antarcticus T-34]
MAQTKLVPEHGPDAIRAKREHIEAKLEADLDHDDADKKPRKQRKVTQRAPPKGWSTEEMKALLDIELQCALDNIPRFLEASELADRNASKINNKLRQRHAAAVKALQAASADVKPKAE